MRKFWYVRSEETYPDKFYDLIEIKEV